ncbi:M16 family metallopeptidase [Desulfurivibrio sp. D14AmB]|uniref:M16 family metallopeptidase n=1 Tax=Desulfurivibrio sp. D14AmB TaxID=3374370 RepID=UPI00376F0156
MNRPASPPGSPAMCQQSTLDNGLRIATETTDSRVVSVGVWIEAGARDEHDLTNGSSHFVEHMLFKGTGRRNAHQIAREFDVMGGMANAFTSTETTCFYATVLADRLPQLADLLADIVLNSSFLPAEVDNEREVILQEIAMVEDTPDDLVHDLFNRELWGRHPLGNTVLGSPRVIGALTPHHLLDYVQRHYTPGRILIAAAGQVEHDSFRQLWAQPFGSMPRGPGERAADSAAGSRRAPEFREPVRRIFDRGLEQVHLVMGTYGLGEADPDRYALQLLNTVLGGNMSSRLFQEIREKRGLAYSVYSYLNTNSDSGALGVYLGVDPLAAEEAVGLVGKEIRRLAREPIPAEVLAEARDYARAVIMLADENPEARMCRLARNVLNFNRDLPLAEILAGFDRVTAADIQTLAEGIFVRPLSAVALGPLDDGLLDWDALDE